MIESYLNQHGFRVDKGVWVLYHALSSDTIALTCALPMQSFRCQVRIYAIEDHVDVAGSIVIGTDTLVFVAAGKKVTAGILNTCPTITTTGLDCMVEIVAIDLAGQPIPDDSQEEAACRFQNVQRSFQQDNGEWAKSQAVVYTNDLACTIGSLFSFEFYDYVIAQMSAHVGLDGTEQFRKLILTGRTKSPIDRTLVASDYMTRLVYDSDYDGIADKFDAAIELDTVPSDLDAYDIGDIMRVNGKMYFVMESG
jgi:hypothetical protein